MKHDMSQFDEVAAKQTVAEKPAKFSTEIPARTRGKTAREAMLCVPPTILSPRAHRETGRECDCTAHREHFLMRF